MDSGGRPRYFRGHMRRFTPLVLIAASASAAPPTYSTFELQARARFADGFNLPAGSAFTSGTPALDDAGRVAFRLISVGSSGLAGLWVGGAGAGSVVYQAANDLPVISDPGTADGRTAFDQFTSSISQGLRVHDAATGQVSVALAAGGSLGIQFFGSPQPLAGGRIGFRATIGSNQAYLIHGPKGVVTVAATAGLVPTSPFNFLFTPSFAADGRVAAKLQRVAGGNEIRVFTVDGDSTLIARDQAAAAGSPYASFDNSVSLASDGRVAFIAGLGGGVRGVFLSDGTATVEIARTQAGVLNELEFFAPSANAMGLVAFRGRDGSGRRAIFVGDGGELRRVVGELSPVPTDLGPGQVARPDASPVFGGNPRMNARGDIAFNASLTALGQSSLSWGSGILVAYADSPVVVGDLNGDGTVNAADLTILLGAWGPCPPGSPCPADLDGDGAVNAADLATLLARWD